MGFDRRTIALAPGARRDVDETVFLGALVVVARGEVDVECRAGGRARFLAGDALWLTGLHVCALHNPGREPAELVVASRRRDEIGAPDRSERHGRHDSQTARDPELARTAPAEAG